jgi:hypothetical protein
MTEVLRTTDEADGRALEEIAEKLFWWKKPEEALQFIPRFLAQVMTLGTWEDVQTVGRIFGRNAFRDVLFNAPPGVFDLRSWHYWHIVFGLPVPPLPTRRFE